MCGVDTRSPLKKALGLLATRETPTIPPKDGALCWARSLWRASWSRSRSCGTECQEGIGTRPIFVDVARDWRGTKGGIGAPRAAVLTETRGWCSNTTRRAAAVDVFGADVGRLLYGFGLRRQAGPRWRLDGTSCTRATSTLAAPALGNSMQRRFWTCRPGTSCS